jgi:hypothetical protein
VDYDAETLKLVGWLRKQLIGPAMDGNLQGISPLDRYPSGKSGVYDSRGSPFRGSNCLANPGKSNLISTGSSYLNQWVSGAPLIDQYAEMRQGSLVESKACSLRNYNHLIQ